MINKSNELRKLLVHASKTFNIPFVHICDYLGIDQVKFTSLYLNRNDLNGRSGASIKDEDLLKIAELLGYEIRIVIVKKGVSDPIELRRKLSDAYKEKRTTTEAKDSNKRGSKFVGRLSSS